MLVVGVVMHFVALPSPADPEVITKTRFSSDVAPTLSIDMPSGWTFTHDRAAGRLIAADAHSTLSIETSLVTDGIDAPGFIKLFSDRMRTATGC
jgi:hypothetical protein